MTDPGAPILILAGYLKFQRDPPKVRLKTYFQKLVCYIIFIKQYEKLGPNIIDIPQGLQANSENIVNHR